MELSKQIAAIEKIFARRRKIKLAPKIKPEEVAVIERKYGFELPEEYRVFITTLGNGATLSPISNDCTELRSFKDDPSLERVTHPFPLVESKEWTSDPDYDIDDPKDQALFESALKDGQITLMDDPCEGGQTWILIVTGERRGEVWLRDEEGYLRLPNCSFGDWLKLYLNKKLMPLVNDLFYEEKRRKERENPISTIRTLMKKKSNKRIEWNPPITMEEVSDFEARHNIILPKEYKQFITEIADGCNKFVCGNSREGGTFYSLKDMDSLLNLDKPFCFEENTKQLRLELMDTFGKYGTNPIWTMKFGQIPREEPLSPVWASPDYSVLHGVLPFAFYNDDNERLDHNTQAFLIINGPLKGQVWKATKYRLHPGRNDETFFSWVIKMLEGCAV